MMKKFKNPVLSGFYPDPSICRAEKDFYLVTSTFAYFPGIPVFHSRDLLNWKQIGNAIDRPGQLCYDGHQISQGLFAPTIRYNSGIFYILCTLIKNGGNFVITAEHPQGPWSDPVWLSGADGIDPSIFFDDDGKAWYCGTHPAPEGEAYSGNYEIYIREMDISLIKAGKNPLIGENIGIWRGALKDVIWPEGPHIYKKDGYYYLLHAEGGTGLDHAVCIARAKDIKGPWEGKKSNPIITHRSLGKKADVINVGHADFTDDINGNWWMVLLASRPIEGVCPLGRETFMVPVYWEDGWPCIVTDTGLIENEYPLPDFGKEHEIPWSHENLCDHFNGRLPLNWLALRMPSKKEDIAFGFNENSGALRLYTRAQTIRSREHPSFAGRRLRHKNWAFCASMEFTPLTANDNAGIILLQSEDWHYRFEVYNSDAKSLRLIRAAGKEDEIIGEVKIDELPKQIVLAAKCENMEIYFYYGKDQYSLKYFPFSVKAHIISTEYAGGFTGALAGVFATANGHECNNHADIFWAEYRGLV
ncbi:MAG: glycoside hydrolase family 43 protein [Treponema sp.]|nr:glycoside hydrolase family 43 protein [Treponema sp.]